MVAKKYSCFNKMLQLALWIKNNITESHNDKIKVVQTWNTKFTLDRETKEDGY